MGRRPECREDHGWSRATIVHGCTGVAEAMDGISGDSLLNSQSLNRPAGSKKQLSKLSPDPPTFCPENAAPHFRLGQAHEEVDRLSEALATYKRLLVLYPQSSRIKVKVTDPEKTVGQ